jgi:hypothetical protein
MAKSQKKNSREAKKPKQDKTKRISTAPVPSAPPSKKA